MEDHISKTWVRSGQSLRKWSPLQRLQGNLGFGFFVVVLLTSSTLPVLLTVSGFLDPTSDVVGGFDPFQALLLLLFLFLLLLIKPGYLL